MPRHYVKAETTYLVELIEHDDGRTDDGTHFPFAGNIRFPCDEHRRDYTLEDAKAVAEMVSQSGASWLTREGR